jgi:enoyl-CoA hydratase/carnithine racemase
MNRVVGPVAMDGRVTAVAVAGGAGRTTPPPPSSATASHRRPREKPCCAPTAPVCPISAGSVLAARSSVGARCARIDVVPDLVVVDVVDSVATITLNRPEKLNALNGEMLSALGRAYRQCDEDDEIRVVVLTGAGRAFCSGADLSREGGAFAAPVDAASFRSSPPRPWAFEIRKPVVAAINGHAIGLGFTIAMHADLRVVAAEAMWGVVQVRRGVVGDALSHFTLVRAVGTARAAEILLTGRLFAGSEAIALGVASRCVPGVEVLPAALAMARDMAANASPMSMAMSKRILWDAATADARTVDDLETAAHHHLMGSPDSREGGMAAAEKRPPRFTSRVTRDWPVDGPLAEPGF